LFLILERSPMPSLPALNLDRRASRHRVISLLAAYYFTSSALLQFCTIRGCGQQRVWQKASSTKRLEDGGELFGDGVFAYLSSLFFSFITLYLLPFAYGLITTRE